MPFFGMKKSQIIILVLAVAVIGVLYSLPRVVVDNEEGTSGITEEPGTTAPAVEEMHDAPISSEAREALSSIASRLKNEVDREKFVALADTLAALYTQAGRFDSAAYFMEQAALKVETIERWEKAGIAYYEAYTFAMSEQKVAYLADKTRSYLNKVLEKDPKTSGFENQSGHDLCVIVQPYAGNYNAEGNPGRRSYQRRRVVQHGRPVHAVRSIQKSG